MNKFNKIGQMTKQFTEQILIIIKTGETIKSDLRHINLVTGKTVSTGKGSTDIGCFLECIQTALLKAGIITQQSKFFDFDKFCDENGYFMTNYEDLDHKITAISMLR